MSVPTLRWLQIHRYEQFDPVRIEFSEHENLILGVNGAGKTRLLKLLRAVLSLDFGDLRAQSFDVEFELLTSGGKDGSPVTIRGRVQDDVVNRGDPGDIPGSMPRQGVALAAVLAFESAGTTFSCELKNGEMIFREGDGGGVEAVVSFSGDGSVLPPFHYPETIDVVSNVIDRRPACESTYVSEADQEFQILTREVEYSGFFTPARGFRLHRFDPTKRFGRLDVRDFGPLFLDAVMVMDRNSIRTGVHPGRFLFPPEGQGELLTRICEAVRAKDVYFVPNVVREKADHIECRGLGIRVRFLDGTELADTELTFGQRRFLYAGLMLLVHQDTPFLMDEVDNGLHPRLVETLLNLLAGRQLFLASHNKLIIDYTNFDGPEDVQKKIHVVERRDDGRQTVRTFDAETARSIYEKIAVAIQSPSEVLLAEGLW